MKFGLKSLNSEIEYELVNIDRIVLNDKQYTLRLTLKYIENGEQKLIYRYSNIQFGRQIRIGSKFIKDSVVKNDEIIIADIDFKFGKINKSCENSIDYLKEESLDKGIFDHHYIPKDRIIEFVNKRCLIHEDKFIINNTEVEFIMIPTYEIIRTFAFGFNNYNDILVKGLGFFEDSTNKIYNPEKSIEHEDEDGSIFKYVQLRNKISDSNAPLVGDLIYYKQIRKIITFFVDCCRTGKYNPFYSVNFPFLKLRTFQAYGKFVTNKNDQLGFEIKTIGNIEYGERYYYGRDNDGRTTPSKKGSMKSIFGGKRKTTVKKGKLNDINHNTSGDPSIDPESLQKYIDGYEFEDRKLNGQKISKLDQENIAAKKTPGDDVERKGSGVMDENGKTGSGIVSVKNDVELQTNAISGKKYWDKFPTIIQKVEEIIGKSHNIHVSYLNENLTFQLDSCMSSFRNVFDVQNDTNFYFIQIQFAMKSFYIIEMNAEEFDISTSIFWESTNGDVLLQNMIEKFLRLFFEKHGLIVEVKKALEDDIEIDYSKARHQYVVRKTNSEEMLSEEYGINNHAMRIAEKILNNF